MATTEQKRKWYPEHVTNHADRGKAGYKPICDWSGAALIAVPNNLDGVYIEPVHPKTAEAWDAYIFLMNHFDQSITNAGGVNSCRNIGTSVWPSLHAYIIAIDNPPNDRKSAEFQAAVLAVKTNNGKTVFKNLASINDRMHDEIDCSPADLSTGIDWATVEGYEMPISDDDAAKIANAVANVKVSRAGKQVSWLQETADIKTILLGLNIDSRTVSDADLDAAVDELIAALPDATVDRLRDRLI